MGDNNQHFTIGSGNAHTKLPSGTIITISASLHVPQLCKNLLSVREVTTKGKGNVEFFPDHCLVEATSPLGQSFTIHYTQFDNLYPLGVGVPQPTSNFFAIMPPRHNDAIRWHHHIGHLHIGALKVMTSKNMVIVLSSQFDSMPLCKGCLSSKQHKVPFPTWFNSLSSTLLHLVHTDLCSLMPTLSLGGSYYFLTFIDDHSYYTYVYLLKHKYEVFSKFQTYKALVEN